MLKFAVESGSTGIYPVSVVGFSWVDSLVSSLTSFPEIVSSSEVFFSPVLLVEAYEAVKQQNEKNNMSKGFFRIERLFQYYYEYNEKLFQNRMG